MSKTNKTNEQVVWLLTKTSDDEASERQCVNDLLQSGALVFATLRDAKLQAFAELLDFYREDETKRDEECKARLEKQLAAAKTKKAKAELLHREKWSSPCGISITPHPLEWQKIKGGGVHCECVGRYWLIEERLVQV